MYLLITIQLFLVAFSLYGKRDVYHPAFQHAVIWLLVFVAVACIPLGVHGLLFMTYAMFGAGGLLFAFCSMVVSGPLIRRPITSPLLYEDTPLLARYLRFLQFIVIAGLPIFLYNQIKLAILGDPGNLFANMRIGAVEGAVEGTRSWSGYFVTIAFLVFFLNYLNRKTSNKKSIIWLLIAMVYALFSTSRTSFFQLLIAIFMLNAFCRRFSQRIVWIAGLIAGMLIFIGLGFLLNKMGEVATSDANPLIMAFNHFYSYAAGGVIAFDQYVRSPHPILFGKYTLRFFFEFASVIGFPVQRVVIMKDFIEYPLVTNVYTVYYLFFNDFGWLGAFLSQAVLGGIHGSLYSRAVNGYVWFVVMASLLIFPLFMQFFDEQYFSGLSLWMQYGILLTPFWRVKLSLDQHLTRVNAGTSMLVEG